MKYLLVVGDGMADNPVEELEGRTPLQAAHTPCMDRLAGKARLGSARTVPEGCPAGTDTALLSILGCDPRRYDVGRSWLEALGLGIRLSGESVSYRCNLVSLEQGDMPFRQKKLLSHNGGNVDATTAMALMSQLLGDGEIRKRLAHLRMEIEPNPSFRQLAIQRGGTRIFVAPPHDSLGQTVGRHLSSCGKDGEELWSLMKLANEVLERHPYNRDCRKRGRLAANGLWFWAAGSGGHLPDFRGQYGRRGAVISAVPVVNGIAAAMGLRRVSVEGATGQLNTNYEGKAWAAMERFRCGDDFVCIHVEAPDELTHMGDLEGKLRAIECLDACVLEPLVAQLEEERYRFRLLVLSDHKTLLSTRTHDNAPVPFLLYDSTRPIWGCGKFSESDGENSGLVREGTELMPMLFEREEKY